MQRHIPRLLPQIRIRPILEQHFRNYRADDDLAREVAGSSRNTLTAVVSLALGIGSAAAIFTVADQARFRLLPVEDPSRLVLLDWAAQPLHFLLAMVGVLLLITCVNLATLLVIRSAQRQKELAVRASLGASRLGLVRMVMTECLGLSIAGSPCATNSGEWPDVAYGYAVPPCTCGARSPGLRPFVEAGFGPGPCSIAARRHGIAVRHVRAH